VSAASQPASWWRASASSSGSRATRRLREMGCRTPEVGVEVAAWAIR
jgi:hypothetical protein